MLPSKMFFDDVLIELSPDVNMRSDIYEKDNQIFIEMDAPGYDKKDIKVECNKENITIKLEKEKEEKENKKYLHRERKSYEKLERTFHVEDINEDSIAATFKDGILTISVEKVDEDKNKKIIEIK